MPEPKSKPIATRARNAAASRQTILEHAIAEFAAQGFAGARTASIADAAGVNKALLYYYFKDKDSLYSAALQSVFCGLVEDVLPLLEGSLSPGEKLLRFARVHFEYLLHHPNYSRLIRQELSWTRADSRHAGGPAKASPGRGTTRDAKRGMGEISGAERVTVEPSGDFLAIAKAHFIPLHRAGLKVVEDGIACGEFRKIEGASVLRTVLGMNVFYFTSAPIMRIVRGIDPFSPECIRRHIATALDFAGASLFTDREYGIRLAKKISTASPVLPRELRGKESANEARKASRS